MRWALVLAVGCGRIGFDATHDSGVAVGGFGTARPLGELATSANEYMPSLRADQLEIVYGSQDPPSIGQDTLLDATRATTSDAFGSPQMVLSSGVGYEPALSDDGLELIYIAPIQMPVVMTRATLASAWSTPVLVPELASDITGVVYETTRPSRGAAWATPRTLDEFAGLVLGYPTASADGLELFIEDDRTPVHQILRATRTSLTAPFGPLELVDVGFPDRVVGDPELAHDGTALYFTVQDGANNDFQLYVVTR